MDVTRTLAILAVLVAVSVASPARIHGRTKRVVGGAPYSPGEYPFSVSLWYLGDNNYYTANTTDRDHTCGGSLIRDNWVLTSAVCFDDNFLPGTGNLSNWLVVLGMYNQLDAEAEAQILTADEIHYLPEYSLGESYGDLALLRLSSPADLSDPLVDTVSYNTDDSCPVAGEKCTIIGWGQIAEEPFGNGSYVPNAAEVSVEDTSQCAATYGQPDIVAMMGPLRIDAGSVCAGLPEGGKDACSGDSGSPLLCRCGPNGELRVVASVTTGFGCARPGYSGVYANIGHFSSWITDTIGSA